MTKLSDAVTTKPLRRRAAGRRPQYFADPATDKLMSMVLVLAQELSVTRDRLDSLLNLLEGNKLLPSKAIDTYVSGPDEAEGKAQRRAALLRRLFQVTAHELENTSSKAPSTERDELLRILS